MSVEHLEILVEEPSMEAALRAFLPTVTGDVTFEVYPHQCKSELLQRLPERIRGYAPWLPPSWRILILVDRDDDECVTLKKTLDDAVENAGLRTRSKAQGKSWQVANRLAIEELEAWYFGDWHAVRQAYPRVPDTIPAKKKFRNPDAIRGGTWEAFEKILQSSGYFRGGLRKIEAARNIGAHFQAARNTSQSFQAFCSVVAELLAPA